MDPVYNIPLLGTEMVLVLSVGLSLCKESWAPCPWGTPRGVFSALGSSLLSCPQRRNEHDVLPSAMGKHVTKHQLLFLVYLVIFPAIPRVAFLLCKWHYLAEQGFNLFFCVFLPALMWPAWCLSPWAVTTVLWMEQLEHSGLLSSRISLKSQ